MQARVQPSWPAVPVRPRRTTRRRGRRHAARPSRASRVRSGAAWIAAGLGACLLGGVAVSAPLWSARWNAWAQTDAARQFQAETLQALSAQTVSPAGTTSSSGGAPAANTASGQVLARLVIPAIGVDSYVLQGLTLNDSSVWSGLLDRGPAHLQGSALPGQPGNDVIFGHVNVWGAVFLQLHRLRPADEVLLETPGHTYIYQVTGSQAVAPTDVAAVQPHGRAATLQLVTCTGLWDTQRLIVYARLVAGPTTAAATGPVSLATARSLAGASEQALLRPPPVFQPIRGLAGALLRWPYAQWRQVWRDLQGLHWQAAWRAALRQARLVRGTAVPSPTPPEPALTYQIAGAWRLPGGQARVVVQEEAPASATPARVLAYTVGGGASGPSILAVRPVRFRTPQVWDISPPTAATAWQRGVLACGGDSVHWWVGPVQPVPNDGFTFQARASTLTLLQPDGLPLGGVAQPQLSEGLVPVACGDLTGDGTTSLVVRTSIPPESGKGPDTGSVAVYALEGGQATLIGQMSGGDAAPALVQPAPDGPWDIVVPQAQGPAQLWIWNDGQYALAPAGTATPASALPGVSPPPGSVDAGTTGTAG